MKKRYTLLFGILFGWLFAQTSFAQLSVNQSSDANELIDTFINDNGNLSYSNASLTGADVASGIYVGADFGVSEGVILSTGSAIDAAGPNNTMATTTVNNTDGDVDLEVLAGKSTNDAISLSADFVAVGNVISFSYIFASEDYDAYVCSPFSDVMAVFVDGGDYDNQNVTLVPSTDLLVTSNTVNSGVSGEVWADEGCPEGGLDNIDLYVDNEDGLNHQYNGRTVVLAGEIDVTPGETYSIRWAIADGNDALFDSALLLEAGSLSSSDSECAVAGGELTVDGPSTVCKSDGIDDSFTLNVDGAEGENMVYLVTWDDGEIILISEEPEFNLEGIPGNGICLFWNLSYDGEIEGVEVDQNAFDITGACFELSNPVEVTEYFTDGGEITTEDPTIICALDGEGDPIDVSLEGEQGENTAWVITDADLNILSLPEGPPFDLEEAGEGVCIIWHLSWSGDLEGAEVGANAGELEGDCFDLSNPIEVTRYVAEGGELTIDGPTTVCKSDGLDNIINLTLEGAEGENQTYLVTWADGEIFMMSDQSEFNLEGVPGNGICLFWSISWNGEIEGLEMGANAFDISGDCFDLSNPVEVTEYFTEGGEISTDDPTTICALDGEGDPINVSLEGEQGENTAWVITDADLNILGLSEGPPFDLEGAGDGVCLIWHLSWSGDLEGAEVGANAGNLSGDCFDLSNSIEVTRFVSNGGEISTDDPTTICVDNDPDPINVTLEGDQGENMAWVITDADLNILDLPAGPPFDLNGAGVGVCLIWNLSWSGNLEGAEIGENAGELFGDCFDLSNSIEVLRLECDDCTAEGGELTIEGPTTVCKSDGLDDIINLTLEGAEGDNQTYLVTWANGEIFMMSNQTEFNLEGVPGNGTCLFWSISWNGEVEGLEMGANAFDISGDCFELSNSVQVIEYFTDGGEISTTDPTTICTGDGIDDLIDVTLEGTSGMNTAWVITDAELNILDLPAGPPFNFEGSEEGECLIWNLSWSGSLEGAEIGENAGELSGDCFDLSNSIEVIREGCEEENIALLNGADWEVDYSISPNPSEGFTQVVFESNQSVRVTIEVYNLNGQKIGSLFNQLTKANNSYTVYFDGSDLEPGMYICRIGNGKIVKMAKMMIAK